MFCPSCGKDVKSEGMFCPYCRQRLNEHSNMQIDQKLNLRKVVAIFIGCVLVALVLYGAIESSITIYTHLGGEVVRFHQIGSCVISLSSIVSNFALAGVVAFAILPRGKNSKRAMMAFLSLNYSMPILGFLVFYLISLLDKSLTFPFSSFVTSFVFSFIGTQPLLIYGLLKNKKIEIPAGGIGLILSLISIVLNMISGSDSFTDVFVSFLLGPYLWFYILLLFFPILSQPMIEKQNVVSLFSPKSYPS